MIQAIIVDDEQAALDVFSRLLTGTGRVRVQATYPSARAALEQARDLQPDVLFLDIQMDGISGLGAVGPFLDLWEDVDIVFVTAYDRYAVEAFELSALDYLLKPVTERRLLRTLDRLDKGRSRKAEGDIPGKQALYIRSLGPFMAMDAGGKTLRWRTRKGKELFSYLWLNRHQPVNKDRIMEDVFAHKEMDQAVALLHTTVYQLRRKLRQLDTGVTIRYESDAYTLEGPLGSDLEDLEAIWKEDERSWRHMDRLMDLYQGDFLEESYLWAIPDQLHVRHRTVEILRTFLEEQPAEEPLTPTARSCLIRLFDIDNQSEEIVDYLIRYLGERGRRGELERFYAHYLKVRQQEDGGRPSEQIQRLFESYWQE